MTRIVQSTIQSITGEKRGILRKWLKHLLNFDVSIAMMEFFSIRRRPLFPLRHHLAPASSV